MRTWSLAPILVAAAFVFAGAALAQDEHPGLFSGQDEAGAKLEVGVRLWWTEGDTKVVSRSLSGKFERDRSLMAIVEGEASLPDLPWVSVDGRLGTTLTSDGGRFEGEDSDASFDLFEVNLAVGLAGRGSPLAPQHALPETHAEAFAGVKVFREDFDADLTGGGSAAYETMWIAPQVGLRGYWHLGDTYADESLQGWGLSGGVALVPWAMVSAESDVDGGRSADQDSSRGYGYSWNLDTSYRSGPLTVSLGYEWQILKTESGDEDLSGGGSGDLYLLESKRKGFFLGVGVGF